MSNDLVSMGVSSLYGLITMFKMGEVSKKLGLNPQTFYFYERIGLMPSPQRTESGYRLFSQWDVDLLTFITRAKSLGLSLEEIKEILDLKEGKLLTCRAVYERLNNKVQAIKENIQDRNCNRFMMS